MIPPALSRLGFRLFGSSKPVAAHASRTTTLGQPHRRIGPRAIFEADDLDRITGVGLATTIEAQRRRVMGGEREHGTVTTWELRNATLSGGYIYKRDLKHRVDGRAQQWLKRAPTVHATEGVVCCTYFGGVFFGHSIRDDMPMTLLAGSLGTPVRTSARLFDHQREYLRIAGLEATPHDNTVFDRLIVIDDHHQSLHRIERTRELRSRVRAFLPRAEHAGVFINRSATGVRRRLTNESGIIELFASRGFAIVDPGAMAATDILSLVAGARIVAGVEGSHLAHGLLGCADDCTYLVLQPPQRFNNIYKDFTDAMGMGYAFVVGHAGEGEDFRIDEGSLARMLDRVQRPGGSAIG